LASAPFQVAVSSTTPAQGTGESMRRVRAAWQKALMARSMSNDRLTSDLVKVTLKPDLAGPT
jgi:hypothetical protein